MSTLDIAGYTALILCYHIIGQVFNRFFVPALEKQTEFTFYRTDFEANIGFYLWPIALAILTVGFTMGTLGALIKIILQTPADCYRLGKEEIGGGRRG